VAFVRSKQVTRKDSDHTYRYYQVVRNYREKGKHRQEFIRHLGEHPTVEAAIAAEQQEENRWRAQASRLFKYAEGSKAQILSDLRDFRDELGNEIPDLEYARNSCDITSQIREEHLELPFEERNFEYLRTIREMQNLWSQIIDYHKVMQQAEWYQEWANKHRRSINELREIQRVYFVR
jgi:hypothetical protein